MKLKDFIKEEIDNLNEFADYWEVRSQLDPENFPKEINVGEWSEQYLTWLNLQK